MTQPLSDPLAILVSRLLAATASDLRVVYEPGPVPRVIEVQTFPVTPV